MNFKSLIPLAFTCFVGFTLAQNINAMVGYQQTTYAFDGLDWLEDGTGFVPYAYEITNGVQSNKFALPLSNQGAVQQSSFVVGNTLYQFSGAYGDATFSSYSLPLASPVTATNSVELPNQIQGIPAVLSSEDNIALALCSRYLTVVSLSSFTVTGSQLAVSGSKKTPGSLVYNHQNNKAYYFQTNYCFAGFCQHIYVYDISAAGEISTAVESDSFAPDYATTFNTGELSGCAIDYSANAIWCINHGTNQLVEFNMNNLNNYTLIPIPGTLAKGQVTFDFTGRRVFFSDAHIDNSYSVYEMDLEGNVIGSLASNSHPVASISFANSPNSVNIGGIFQNGAQVNMMTLDANGNNSASNEKIIDLL